MPMKIDIIGAVGGTDLAGALRSLQKIGDEMVSMGQPGPSKFATKNNGGTSTLVVSAGFADRWGPQIKKTAEKALVFLKRGDVSSAEAGYNAIVGKLGGMPDDVQVIQEADNVPVLFDPYHLGEADVEESNVHLRMEHDVRNPDSSPYGSGGTMNYGIRITSASSPSGQRPNQSPPMRKSLRRGDMKLFTPDKTPEAGQLISSNFFDAGLESNIGEDFDTDVYYDPAVHTRRKVSFSVVKGDELTKIPEDGTVLGELSGLDDYALSGFGEVSALGDDLGSILGKAKSAASKVTSKVKSTAKTGADKVKKGAKTIAAPVVAAGKAGQAIVEAGAKTATAMAETAESGAKGVGFLAKYGKWLAIGAGVFVGLLLIGLVIWMMWKSKKSAARALPSVTV